MEIGGGSPAAGWYPDPEDATCQRYWDGGAWTEHRAPLAGQGGWPPAGAGAAGAVPIDTWLWQSIVAALLCCQPLGIVAIVFAAQAQSAINVGDLVQARNKAQTAKVLTLISVGLAAVIVLGGLLIAVLGVSGLTLLGAS
jgi:hypothetical protein